MLVAVGSCRAKYEGATISNKALVRGRDVTGCCWVEKRDPNRDHHHSNGGGWTLWMACGGWPAVEGLLWRGPRAGAACPGRDMNGGPLFVAVQGRETKKSTNRPPLTPDGANHQSPTNLVGCAAQGRVSAWTKRHCFSREEAALLSV